MALDKDSLSGIETLEPGKVPKRYLALLYQLLKLGHTPIREAVVDHLCNGVLQSTAAETYNVKKGSISRQIRRLNQVNEITCELARYHKSELFDPKVD